jgi:hypothetical protein
MDLSLFRGTGAICRKYLRISPGSRNASARGLAEGLELFQSGKLVSIRGYPLRERSCRWAARRPFEAAVSPSVLLVLLTLH